MYSTCLFCTHPLGSNETLETFPVGRRLAFDADKGRLWVICSHCAQWNLTPLEERWEAIDTAERSFRETLLRKSTENIGLARMPDGTDLIRIGKPQRPELAAWRYGSQFAQRQKRVMARGVVVLAAGGVAAVTVPLGPMVSGMLAGFAISGGAMTVFAAMGAGSVIFRDRFIRDDAGQYLRLTKSELPNVRLIGSATGWALRVPYQSRRATLQRKWTDALNPGNSSEGTLTGAAAMEGARQLLPLVNGAGARASNVKDAVSLLAEWGGGESVFTTAATHTREWAAKRQFGDPGALSYLPRTVRLALEMAAHEDQEQRVLAGELAELERAWRDAETVAAIADDLLVPGPVRRALAILKKGGHHA